MDNKRQTPRRTVNAGQKTKKEGVPALLKHFVAGVVLAIVLLLGVKVFLDVYTRHGQELIVPDFSNLTFEEAESMALNHDMRVVITDSVFLKRMKKGAVYRQNPAPGSRVKKDKLITLTVNARISKTITMPDLIGLSMRQAKAEILSRGLILGRLIYQPDLATNNVLKQLVNGSEVEPGTELPTESIVDIVVGLNGRDCVTYVPDVIGLKQISAVGVVNDNSLNIKKMYFDETVLDYDDSLNAMVFNQRPEPSDSISVGMGSDVTLYLTLDENKIPVKEEEVVE